MRGGGKLRILWVGALVLPKHRDGPEMLVDQVAPTDFRLTVIFEGERFDCGSYVSRVAALQAGRLFTERKQGEQSSRKKRPRKKGMP